MRLIDGDGIGLALVKRGQSDKRFKLGDTIRYTPSEVQQIINEDIPTVDAVPVRHGRWVKSGQSFVYPHKFRNYSCSVCGYDIEKTKYNYCPNCWAKMDGGADN